MKHLFCVLFDAGIMGTLFVTTSRVIAAGCNYSAAAKEIICSDREDRNVSPWQMVDSEKEQPIFDILGSEMLDETTIWQQTAQEAKVEIDADPQNAFTWFNLGTSLTRLGELTGEAEFYENGAAAFDQAFILGVPPRIVWYQFRPYIAYLKASRYQDMIDLANTILETQGGRNVEETYLYQGHALAFLGDGASAVEAYKLALKLNENFYPAQWALASITGGS
jgi:tetratricopeptide (TPR) repeat protein